MVAGREASPKDAKATERLMEYWLHGKGAGLIRWKEGGDYDRCITEIGKATKGKLGSSELHGLCGNLHKRATGMSTAEHAKMENAKKGKK